MLELVARYGVETILEFMSEIQAHSERLVRAAIAEIPDGCYRGEAFMEDDGSGAEGPFTIRVAVWVEGGGMRVDFRATDLQTRGFINVPLASTYSTVRTTIMSILGIDIQFVNAGAFPTYRDRGAPGLPGEPAATGSHPGADQHLLQDLRCRQLRPRRGIA